MKQNEKIVEIYKNTSIKKKQNFFNRICNKIIKTNEVYDEVYVFSLKIYSIDNEKLQKSFCFNNEIEIKFNVCRVYSFWLHKGISNLQIVFEGEILEYTFDPSEIVKFQMRVITLDLFLKKNENKRHKEIKMTDLNAVQMVGRIVKEQN